MQQIEEDILALGYQVLTVSPDRPEKQLEMIERLELTYTLLSDSPMSAARSIGIAFEVDADTQALYKKFGIDLEGDSGETHHQLPVPTVLIVGTDGLVHFSYSNIDHRQRISGDVVLAAARAAAGELGD